MSTLTDSQQTPAAQPRLLPRLTASEKRNLRNGLLFLAPWIVGFCLFTFYPVAASLYYSFCRYRVVTPPQWIGLGNYRELATGDPYFWKSLYNTTYMFLEVPAYLLLAILLALLLNKAVRGMPLFRTIIFLPVIVPVVATSMLWMWIYNSDYGIINLALTRLNLPTVGWLVDPRIAKLSFILMDLWSVGYGMVIFLASLQSIPAHMYEAAELDGAGAWAKTRHVTLPMISPVIFFMVVMGVIGTFQYFTQTFIMTQGGPENSTRFYALHLYRNAFEYFNMGYACALAWILFLLTLFATLLIFRSSARWVYYEEPVR